jgi:hypothetical protein
MFGLDRDSGQVGKLRLPRHVLLLNAVCNHEHDTLFDAIEVFILVVTFAKTYCRSR